MRLKVFIGMVEIAGYYSALAEGLRKLGVDTTLVCLSENPFKYEHDIQTENFLIRLVRYPFRRRAAVTRRQLLRKLFWAALSEICRPALLIWAIARHDVFIFGFASSGCGFCELALFRAMKRRVICVFNGSDCRPPYIDGARLSQTPSLATSPDRLLKKTRAVKRMVARVDRYADVVVSAPPQALFQTKPFVLFQALGLPVRLPPPNAPRNRRTTSTTVRILHCPSLPEAKGTASIRGIIDSLKRKGYEIEYVEVIGQPNATVMEELAQCDFVIDHLYSDSPIGGFATEAAFFGKPAVVAGYCQAFVETLSKNDVPPTVYCAPEDAEDAIRRLIVDSDLRRDLGARARAFVESRWAPAEVASRFLLLIRGEIPQEWIRDPRTIDFVPVAGMTDTKAREIISRLVDAFGPAALHLGDKPHLEKLFVEFARTGKRRRAVAAA